VLQSAADHVLIYPKIGKDMTGKLQAAFDRLGHRDSRTLPQQPNRMCAVSSAGINRDQRPCPVNFAYDPLCCQWIIHRDNDCRGFIDADPVQNVQPGRITIENGQLFCAKPQLSGTSRLGNC